MTQVSESAASRIVLERQVVRGCTVVTLAGELDLGVASALIHRGGLGRLDFLDEYR